MGLRPTPTSTGVSRFGAPIPSSCFCQAAPASRVPKRIFLNSLGNSLAQKSRTFWLSGVPAAYSMPA